MQCCAQYPGLDVGHLSALQALQHVNIRNFPVERFSRQKYARGSEGAIQKAEEYARAPEGKSKLSNF